MQNYIFSTVAAACAVELILEFAPFVKDATLKKYLRYVFALVLSLCIVSPFSESVSFGDLESVLENGENASVPAVSEYIYFENESFSCECTENGVPKRDTPAACDMYIRECCFGIIRNAATALSDKLVVDVNDIGIGIAFDVTDISSIKIICAYIDVDSKSKYLKSDARDYLGDLLGCTVYETEVNG